MRNSQHYQAFEIFAKACDLPPGERTDFVDQQCAGDTGLRTEVMSLLKHDESPANLDAALIEPARELMSSGRSQTMGSASSAQTIPKRVGAYDIVRKIGEGGMGVVFEAEQQSPKRRVALKIVRGGQLTAKLIRRFEHEAYVLGQLQHPGIAHIYESGMVEVDGRSQPFFAMELIQGERITAYAQQQQLTTRQRLELIARVCDAVQHAHQKGIIHRDLKPANILVVEQGTITRTVETGTRTSVVVDELGQPKILDFGIARFTDTDVQSATLQTDVGQLVGTLAYMSPEQVLGDSSALDTRCDVYAIGVILFQLLTDRLPLEFGGKPVAEAARIIRDDDPISVSAIDRACRGDIDTIIAKALEKDPNRRYASAAQLASDLRHCLREEPISARPASAWYNLQKFSKRNKGLVAGLCMTFAALFIGLIGTVFSLAEATRQRDEAIEARSEANLERDRTDTVAKFQSRLIANIHADQFGAELMSQVRQELQRVQSMSDTKSVDDYAAFERVLDKFNGANVARSVLSEVLADRAIQEINDGFTDDPLTKARLLHNVARSYMSLGLAKEAVRQFTKSLEIRRKQLGSDNRLTLKTMHDLALAQRESGQLADAEAMFREVLARRQQLFGDSHSSVLKAQGALASLLQSKGELDEAEALLEKSLANSGGVVGTDDPDTLQRRNTYGALLLKRGNVDEAIVCYQELLPACNRVLGPDTEFTVIVRNNLMSAMFRRNRLIEAEAIAREVLESNTRLFGDAHVNTVLARNNLGVVLLNINKPEEAEALFREAYQECRRQLQPDQELHMKSVSNLIDALLALDRPEEAEEFCHELLKVRRELAPPEPGLVAQTLEQLGHAYYDQNRYADARDTWDECLALRSGIDSNHWLTNRARNHLGAAFLALGEFEAAEELLQGSYEALSAQSERIPAIAGSGCLAAARSRLEQLYQHWGEPAQVHRWRDSNPESSGP